MKTRPILFTGEMVRAILAGRKTQTRRVCKSVLGIGQITELERSTTPHYDWIFRDKRMRWNDLRHDEMLERCPHGAPGDRLWVRETWAWPGEEHVLYRADEHARDFKRRCDADPMMPQWTWSPSIHMPRELSRITLEVTDVRVERVRSISEADCIAEGLALHPTADGWPSPALVGSLFDEVHDAYQNLWDSINAKRGYCWEKNPWVWVVEFKAANETAQEKWKDAMGRLRAFDRQPGAGE
jgi:hypothetical protein